MKALDIFSLNDKQRLNDFIEVAELGKLALITKQDRPIFLMVPFNQTLLENGVHCSIAINLFAANCLSLAQAAALANITIYDFLDLLRHIQKINYPRFFCRGPATGFCCPPFHRPLDTCLNQHLG